jgi:hypothetical protein
MLHYFKLKVTFMYPICYLTSNFESVISAKSPEERLAAEAATSLAPPVLAVEAEAMYAPFFALLRQLAPQDLEIALASIRRRIAEYDASVPLDESL